MPVKFNSLKTDPAKERDGAWVRFSNDLELLIARVNNPNFNAEVYRLMNELGLTSASLSVEQLQKDERFLAASLKATARTILLGWRGPLNEKTGEYDAGLVDEEGNAIPYSVEKAEELLRDSGDVERFVSGVAGSREHFRRQAVEAAKGNSAPASTGT